MKNAFAIGFIVFLPVMMLVISFIAGAFISRTAYKKDIGCYISHVQECLDCHNKNLTYLLCSGFCVPSADDDLSFPGDKNPSGSFCSIHPTEDCFETIPQECLT